MADQAIIRIEYNRERLEKLGFSLEDEVTGWLQNDETEIGVISIEEIEG